MSTSLNDFPDKAKILAVLKSSIARIKREEEIAKRRSNDNIYGNTVEVLTILSKKLEATEEVNSRIYKLLFKRTIEQTNCCFDIISIAINETEKAIFRVDKIFKNYTRVAKSKRSTNEEMDDASSDLIHAKGKLEHLHVDKEVLYTLLVTFL